MTDYKKYSNQLFNELSDAEVFRELDGKEQVFVRGLISSAMMLAITETNDKCEKAHEKYKRHDINSGPIITRD